MDDRKGMKPVKPVSLIPNGSWKSEEETEGGIGQVYLEKSC